MNNLLTIIFCMTLLCGYSTTGKPKDGFIYGKITTIEGSIYEGYIRWGGEEVFWTDFFNAHKPPSPHQAYNQNEKSYNSFMHWFNDNDNKSKSHAIVKMEKKELIHVWVSQFGDMRSMRMMGNEEVEIELRNGEKIKVKGGSNDIKAEIKVLDQNIGALTINWDNINRVDFFEAPSGISNSFGAPLFGTVTTKYGDLTGYILWDHDERLSTDVLDGNTVDGKVSLTFETIKALTKEGEGTKVTLHSGRSISLTGSNDVSAENRGLVVVIKDLGRIQVAWNTFLKLRLHDDPEWPLTSYNDFSKPAPLRGIIHTRDGKTIRGRIVYDLDETLDLEMIQGKHNGMEYSIPIKNIKSIAPENENSAMITLKNGHSVSLGNSHDVADINSGMLVFGGDSESPEYIPWHNLKTLRFD